MPDFDKDPEDCDHDCGTTQVAGRGRWLGGKWVEDVVTACEDCGAVLAVDN